MLSSFHFFHSQSIWWMPTVCVRGGCMPLENKDKVCTFVSLYSKEGHRRHQMVINLCWKLKRSDEIVRMPGDCFRVDRKGIAEKIFKLGSEWLEGASHGKIVLTHRWFQMLYLLKGAYFQWLLTILRICKPTHLHTNSYQWILLYDVLICGKNTCLLISLINSNFISRFPRIRSGILLTDIYQIDCSCIFFLVFMPVILFVLLNHSFSVWIVFLIACLFLEVLFF